MGEWIRLTDKQPENGQDILAFGEDAERVIAGYYEADRFWVVNDNYWPNAFKFSWWMPFPKPPYTITEKDVTQ